MQKPTEEDLIRLAKALGEATTRCSEQERAHIKALYEDVQKFGDEQKEKGVYIDRSAFFAAGIILHPEIENEGVRKAAVDYVEMDHLFVKANEDEPAEGGAEAPAAPAEAPAATPAPAE